MNVEKGQPTPEEIKANVRSRAVTTEEMRQGGAEVEWDPEAKDLHLTATAEQKADAAVEMNQDLHHKLLGQVEELEQIIYQFEGDESVGLGDKKKQIIDLLNSGKDEAAKLLIQSEAEDTLQAIEWQRQDLDRYE